MEMYNSDGASASVEHDDQSLLDINGFLEPASPCCIYKVPSNLRKVDEEAYTPRLISIGPFHRDSKELADMEKQKTRYRKSFDLRITKGKWNELKSFIKINEQHIRYHYAEPFEVPSDMFVEMILFDAVFIIELFLRFYHMDKSDHLLIDIRLKAIKRDLLLLENQLPYFVLEKLYNLAFSNIDDDHGELLSIPQFRTLSCLFFQLHRPPYRPPYDREDDQQVNVKHFTDLCRHALVLGSQLKAKSYKHMEHLPNAVKLHKSGVKFKRRSGTYLLDIKFEKKRRIIPFFNKVELHIPRIEVYDDTEGLVRNLMVFEQCHYPSETYLCSYIDLMDFLINTESDVELLVEEGIIYNSVGDNAIIAKKFNKLRLRIPANNGSYYSEIFKDLRRHYDNPWNHAKATLKSVYFSSPWRGTGTVVASLLLLLTLIQTVFMLYPFFAKGLKCCDF